MITAAVERIRQQISSMRQASLKMTLELINTTMQFSAASRIEKWETGMVFSIESCSTLATLLATVQRGMNKNTYFTPEKSLSFGLLFGDKSMNKSINSSINAFV